MEGLPDNLTPEARAVFDNALESARSYGQNFIGTEHILLGLLADESDSVCQLLRGMGVDLRKTRTAVEFLIGRGDNALTEAGLTPRSKVVVRIAESVASEQHSEQIRTTHILVGLLREGEGIAAGILESFGVYLQRVFSAASTLEIP